MTLRFLKEIKELQHKLSKKQQLKMLLLKLRSKQLLMIWNLRKMNKLRMRKKKKMQNLKKESLKARLRKQSKRF